MKPCRTNSRQSALPTNPPWPATLLKDGKPLPLDLLRDYYKEFSNLSLSQRMSLYKFREDRADVIVPALLIYINVMRWADADEIFVPKIRAVFLGSLFSGIRHDDARSSRGQR